MKFRFWKFNNKETRYLLSTKSNTENINQGIEDLTKGKGISFSNFDEATEFFIQNNEIDK